MQPPEILSSAPFELTLEDDGVILSAVLDDGSEIELVLGTKEQACEEM